MTINDILISNLQEQRKVGTFCDIQISVGNQHTWAHSAIVCPFSTKLDNEYFSQEKYKAFSTKNNLHSFVKIKLNDKINNDCFECLDKLIDFIYGKNTKINNNHALHLISYCQLLNLSNDLIKILNNSIGLAIENKLSIKQDALNNTNFNNKLSDLSDLNIKREDLNDFSNEMDFDNNDKNKLNNLYVESCTEKSKLKLLTEKKQNCNIDDDYKLSNLYDLNVKEENDSNDSSSEIDCDNNDKNEHVNLYFQSQAENSQIKLPTGKTQNCIGCNFKCYKTIDLLNHLQKTGHGGNICSLCWAKLNSANDLKKHIVLHDHPKPYFCPYCELRFSTRSLLDQHLPGHMSDRPFICPHCKKSFKRKNALNCHMIIHSNEKKHLCDECGFSTAYARILRAHKLLHNGNLFKCSYPECTHTTTRKENLKQHFLTHTKEKLFVCETCGQKFSHRKSLKRHLLIHDESWEHTCPHCPFKTHRNDSLKTHIYYQHFKKDEKK